MTFAVINRAGNSGVACSLHGQHCIGAHYTPRAYVERLVSPTLMEPLRADWNGVRVAASELIDQGKAGDARALVEDFHRKLAQTKVLDPACGTGNFLYVAMARMKELSGSRLICIASDFGKYDEHAVKQMNRTIALIRYRRYGEDLLLLEQLTATSARPVNGGAASAPVAAAASSGKKYKTITQQIEEAPTSVLDLYHAVSAYLEAAGDDVQVKVTDFYVAFRRLKNFACLELRNQLGKLLIYARINPDKIVLESGFTRDVRAIGHFGTGDLEITIQSMSDIEKAKPLFDAAYQNG